MQNKQNERPVIRVILTGDRRRDALVLWDLRLEYPRIARHLELTVPQAVEAVQQGRQWREQACRRCRWKREGEACCLPRCYGTPDGALPLPPVRKKGGRAR